MFEFYTKFETEEHYLTHKEIAHLWNIFTLSDNPHIKITSFILKNYLKQNSLREVFYPSRHGMINVYSKDVYIPAYQSLINLIGNDYTEGTVKINGKNYNFKRKKV